MKYHILLLSNQVSKTKKESFKTFKISYRLVLNLKLVGNTNL